MSDDQQSGHSVSTSDRTVAPGLRAWVLSFSALARKRGAIAAAGLAIAVGLGFLLHGLLFSASNPTTPVANALPAAAAPAQTPQTGAAAQQVTSLVTPEVMASESARNFLPLARSFSSAWLTTLTDFQVVDMGYQVCSNVARGVTASAVQGQLTTYGLRSDDAKMFVFGAIDNFCADSLPYAMMEQLPRSNTTG